MRGGEGSFVRTGEDDSVMDVCLLDAGDTVEAFVAVRLRVLDEKANEVRGLVESTKCLKLCLNFSMDFGVRSLGG